MSAELFCAPSHSAVENGSTWEPQQHPALLMDGSTQPCSPRQHPALLMDGSTQPCSWMAAPSPAHHSSTQPCSPRQHPALLTTAAPSPAHHSSTQPCSPWQHPALHGRGAQLGGSGFGQSLVSSHLIKMGSKSTAPWPFSPCRRPPCLINLQKLQQEFDLFW